VSLQEVAQGKSKRSVDLADQNEKKVNDILSLLIYLETHDVFESVGYNPIGVQIP
jgi:hypothetical protein